MTTLFSDLDVIGFWDPTEHALAQYVGAPLTKDTVDAVERILGYRLPPSYIEFMAVQNGGIPRRTCHRTNDPTSWARDHIAITGLYSIGSDRPCSLLGEYGSRFWIEEWGYPQIGIYFADCPSAGHDMVCLDYRACGPNGEPHVVHVDQEQDYRAVFVADTFEAFVRGLQDQSEFETECGPEA